MTATTPPPVLPIPPEAYSKVFQERFQAILRSYFTLVGTKGVITVTGITLDLDKLPTDADVATLRVGEVYRDTTAGNVLKVKV